jgi:NAD(P)H-nitrite reductase large subunit
MDDERNIVCRSEEVTVGEVLQAIENGARDIDAVKRLTRAGMGLCQGRTCSVLVRQLLKWKLNLPDAELPSATTRPPVRLVPSQAFLEAKEQLERSGEA